MASFARYEPDQLLTVALSYWLSLVMVLGFALYLFVLRVEALQPSGQAPVLPSYTVSSPVVPTAKKVQKQKVSLQVHTSAISPRAVAVPACTLGHYALPPEIELAHKAPGLSETMDAPHYYTVNGQNSGQVQQQIQRCAPRLAGNEDFTALTSYRVSWWYQYQSTSDGQCVVVNAKIGMHINQSLPHLGDYGGNTALYRSWQTFMVGLKAHEQGHVDLDNQYASTMLATLQHFPATNCSGLESSINQKMAAHVAQLNAANDAYDFQTSHGATQGAVLSH